MNHWSLLPLVRFVIQALSFGLLFILLVFIVRRLLFAVTIRLARKPSASDGAKQTARQLPNVLILVPCRDEESMILGLAHSLSRLDYPAQRRRVVLIDDGSRDATRSLMQQCAASQDGWEVLSLNESVGKASALNAALARLEFGEIVYVLDADHRPKPDALVQLVRNFDEPRGAAVSGRTMPSNPLVSLAAYYATVELLVHQMVTMRAKNELGLAPAILGSNCAYRRDILAKCNGFPNGAFLEDSQLTLALVRAGCTTRFVQASRSCHQVPVTLRGYLRQHRRWTRGFADVAARHTPGLAREGHLSLPLRLELFLFATGYLDRLAFMGAVALCFISFLNPQLFAFPYWVLYLWLLAPLFQIVVLFWEQRVPLPFWLRLPVIPLFYLLDIFAVVSALADIALGRARVWKKTARVETI